MWETWVRSQGWEDPLEKGKATHSSILAWRILWTVKSMGVIKSQTWLSDFHFHSYLHFKHTVQWHAWVHLYSLSTVTRSSPELFLSCQIETLNPLNSHSPCPPPPSTWQPPFNFLSLWIWLCQVPRINGIIQYLSFCNWLYLTQHNILKVHVRCSIWQNFLPF